MQGAGERFILLLCADMQLQKVFEQANMGVFVLATIGREDILVNVFRQETQVVVSKQFIGERDRSREVAFALSLFCTGGEILDLADIAPPDAPEIEPVVVMAVASHKGRRLAMRKLRLQHTTQVMERDVEIAGGHLRGNFWPEEPAQLFYREQVAGIEQKPFQQLASLIATPVWLSQWLLIARDTKRTKKEGFVAGMCL